MTKIVIIDDDVLVLQLIETFLVGQGYRVETAKSGRGGLDLIAKESPDLILLDLMMPGMDGFETYRRIREMGEHTVLIMSNRQDEKSAVRALEMGAEDYLRKPVDLSVLQAKLITLLRRKQQYSPAKPVIYNDGRLMIDLDNRYVSVRGEPVKLTPTEFRVLSILFNRMGRVVTHEEIIKEVWGTDKDSSLGSLKLYVHYLRQKLEDDPRDPYYVMAEWGIGYRFREMEADTVG